MQQGERKKKGGTKGKLELYPTFMVLPLFSQPSIYIDGWLYAMSMTSVVCNAPVLSQNDSTYHHSVFTTCKWHPFATWTPSFIILVWGHHPPLRRTVFACLQNCYNSCISCSRSALRYDSINSNVMNYSWTNRRLAIPAPAGLLVCKVKAMQPVSYIKGLT